MKKSAWAIALTMMMSAGVAQAEEWAYYAYETRSNAVAETDEFARLGMKNGSELEKQLVKSELGQNGGVIFVTEKLIRQEAYSGGKVRLVYDMRVLVRARVDSVSGSEKLAGATRLDPDSTLEVQLSSGTGGLNQSVRLSLRELELVLFQPSVARERVVGALLRNAWKLVRNGKPDDMDRFSPEGRLWIELPIGDWFIGLSPDLLNILLGRDLRHRIRTAAGHVKPFIEISSREAKAFELALDTIADESTDEATRKKLRALRRVDLSRASTEDHVTLRSLLGGLDSKSGAVGGFEALTTN